MLSTRVGYGGGTTESPTYHDLGDHREVVEVTFDPRRISYDTLLETFWTGQPIDLPPDPNPRVHLAVLPTSARQEAAVRRDLERLSRRGTIQVEILPAASFWPAERLHQKFYLQRGHAELVERLAAEFPSLDAFLDSTAAARLNAWTTPFGDIEDFRQAAEDLGLAPEALDRLVAASGR